MPVDLNVALRSEVKGDPPPQPMSKPLLNPLLKISVCKCRFGAGQIFWIHVERAE